MVVSFEFFLLLYPKTEFCQHGAIVFSLGRVRRAFLLVYTVFPRILQDFSLRNPFVFAAFFPAFNTFPAPCPSIASGFAAAPFSGFLVLRLRKSLQILPRQRAFARVSLRETGLFLCGVLAAFLRIVGHLMAVLVAAEQVF